MKYNEIKNIWFTVIDRRLQLETGKFVGLQRGFVGHCTDCFYV